MRLFPGNRWGVEGIGVSRARFALGVPVALAADMVFFALVRRARPRPFGLGAVPPHTPAMLGSYGSEGLHRVTEVVLSYGRPLAVAGTLTVVETCFSEPDCRLPALEETIWRARLRDEAWGGGDWEGEPNVFGLEPEVQVPADGFGREERAVVVSGRERPVEVVSRDGYEALRFAEGPVVVTAVARFGLGERPVFAVVEDLEPYMAEQRRFILSWLRFWEG
jgi:hypothetical protein